MQSGRRLALFAALSVLCADGAAALAAQHVAETSGARRTCDVVNVGADERPRKEGEATKVTLGVRVDRLCRVIFPALFAAMILVLYIELQQQTTQPI